MPCVFSFRRLFLAALMCLSLGAPLLAAPRTIQLGDMRVVVEETPTGSAKKADLVPIISPWANGIAYYVFADDVNAAQREIFNEAATTWSTVENIQMVLIEADAEQPVNHIYVQNSLTGNNSYLGMVGGRQILNMKNWSVDVALHELGHALGLVHEHQRQDRDSFVTVYDENIEPDHRGDFQRFNLAQYGAYDFESIMHYSQWAFSRNGSQVMVPTAGNESWADQMGMLSGLTEQDRAEITQRYAGLTDPVSVPDAALRTVLLERVDYDKDGVITVSEAASVRNTLDLSASNITDLTGLEAFINLVGFNAPGNQITGVPDLSALSALQIVNLDNNLLTEVPTFSQALNVLQVQYNPLAGDPCTAIAANRGIPLFLVSPTADGNPVVCSNDEPTFGTVTIPDDLRAGVGAIFQATGSDSDGDRTRFVWDFGDGSPLQPGPWVSHTYAAAGDYSVTLFLWDGVGLVQQQQVPVTVSAGNGVPTLQLGRGNARPGDLSGVTLAISHMDNVAALQCDLVFDATTISVDQLVNQASLAPHGFLLSQVAPGRARLTLFDVAGSAAVQQGDLIRLPFRIAADAASGFYPLQLTDVRLAAANAAEVAVAETNNGLLRVVRNGNQVPIALNSSAAIPSSYQTLTSRLYSYDLDGDSLAFRLVRGSDHGTIQIDPVTGDFTYDPNDGYEGNDSFEFVVYDGIQLSRQATVTLTVTRGNAPPVIEELNAPASGYAHAGVSFSAVVSDLDDSDLLYVWDFGDGQRSNDDAPTVAYSEAGQYRVSLTVNDGFNNTVREAVIDIEANEPPTFANISIPVSGRIHQPVHYTADVSDADGDAVTVTWTFDGVERQGSSVSETFTRAGTVAVTVTATDSKGASVQRISNTSIQSATPPTLRYVFVPPTGSVGQEVAFWVGATDHNRNITDYFWTFGDGTGDQGYRVSHVYNAVGTYPVTLRVRDSNSLETRYDGSIEIRDNADPVIQFVNGPAVVRQGSEATWSVTAFDGDNDPLTVNWDFGDGGSAQGTQATHSYAAAGDQIITVTVTDGRGGQSTATHAVSVGDNGAPNIEQVSLPGIHSRNFEAAFAATAVDPDGDAITYHWDFGNGQNADGASGTFRPYENGVFEATLTVRDEQGASSSHQQLLEIVDNDAPRVVFTVVPSKVALGRTTHFLTRATDNENDAFTITWRKGTEEQSGESASFLFEEAGSQQVQLWIRDERGAVYNRNYSITVGDQSSPALRAAAFPASVVLGESFSLSADAVDPDGETPTISWLLANEEVSTSANHEHVINDHGYHTLRLTLSDADGNQTVLNAPSIYAQLAPTLENFSAPDQVRVGDMFSVSAYADDPENHSLTYRWDFGDGSEPRLGRNQDHSYAATGSYTVVLTVTDSFGAVVTRNHVVEAFDNLPPQITAMTVPTEGRVDVAVAVSATAEDLEGQAITYAWDFGDGTASVNGADGQHVFTAPGRYTVTLTVSDTEGGVNRQNAEIEILEYPVIEQLLVPGVVRRGDAVPMQIDAYNPSGGNLTITWDFGDGSAGQSGTDLSAVNHVYAENGLRRQVVVTVSNGVTQSEARAYVAVLGREDELVTFASDSFKARAVSLYDGDDDGEISYREAAAVTGQMFLSSVTGSNQDMTGLEAFINIGELISNNGGIARLPHLSHLTQLVRLDIARNSLVSIPSLPVNLEILDLERNSLSSLPTFPATLKWLNIDRNSYRSGFGVGRLPASLEYLDCSNNSSDTSSRTFHLELQGVTNLKTLICNKNRVKDLSKLPHGLESLTVNHTGTFERVTNLPDTIRFLDLGFCPEITEIDRLPSALETFEFGGSNIHISGYKLASLGNLSHVKSLKELNLRNMDLTALPGLGGMSALETLSVSGNALTEIEDLSGLSNLTTINVGSNDITTMGALPAGLISLTASGNQLTELPELAGLESLEQLHVGNNQLSAIPALDNLTALKRLTVNDNVLTAVAIPASLTALESVDLSNNTLGDLPAWPSFPLLTNLTLNNIGLDNPPDVTALTGLAYFRADDNNLQAVPDFSANTDLVDVSMVRNNFGLDDCGDLNALKGRLDSRVTVNPQADGNDLACPNTAPRIVSVNVPSTGSYGSDITMSAVVEDDENDRVTISWDFGNGSGYDEDHDREVRVSYNETGTYTVTLTARDAAGLEATAEAQIVIGSQAPRVTRYGFPSQTFVNADTPFSIEATDPEGDPISYSWDFGDGGAVVAGQAVSHRFTAVGTYTVTAIMDDGQGGVARFSRDIEVLAENRYPDIVSVTIPNSASVGQAVAMSIVAEDPDGDAITITWELGDGNTSEGASINHTYATAGDYTVRVVVRDSWGYGRSTGGVIQVREPNRDPVINQVTVPSAADVGQSVAMSVDATDPDGDPLTATWSLGDGSQQTGLSINHSYDRADGFLVTLTVTDGRGGSVAVVRNITVSEIPNATPEISAVTIPSRAGSGEAVTFRVTASDPDGDPLTIAWNFGDGSATAASAEVSHTYSDAGDYTVSVSVSDDRGASVNAQGTITIEAATPITELSLPSAVDNLAANAGDALYFRVATGADLAALTFTLAGGTGNADLYALEGALPATDNYDFLAVEAGNAETLRIDSPGETTWFLMVHAEASFSGARLEVRGDAANQPPNVTSVSLPSAGRVGQNLDFSVQADDPDGDPLTITWDFNGEASAEGADVSHAFTTTGVKTVRVTVNDGRGGSVTREGNLTITADQGNNPPQLSGINYPNSAESGSPLEFSAVASDPDGDPLSYAWDFGDGSTATGQTVTHTYAAGGSYTIRVTINDGRGAQVTGTLQYPVQHVPVLSIGDELAGLEGGAGAFLLHKIVAGAGVSELFVTTSGGSGDMALFVRAGQPPAGSNYDFVSWSAGNTERVDITDPAGKTWYVVVYGAAAFSGVTLNVGGSEASGENQAPVINAVSAPNAATVGAALDFSVQATDADGDALTVSWDLGDGTQVSGASVSHSYSSAGNYSVVVTVADGNGGTVNASTMVTVTQAGGDNQPPSITNGSVPTTATVGVAAAFQVETNDPDGDSLTVQWTFGDGAGASGHSVSHSYTAAGTYSWQVTVDDGRGGVINTGGEVTVQAATGPNQAPSITGMTFTPSAESGLPVSFSATATDPDGDPLSYRWVFGDGGEVEGQNINYTFTNGGTVAVQVVVTDGRGGTARGNSSIQIETVPMLTFGQTTTGLNAAHRNVLYFKFTVPADTNSVAVTLSSGTGDADLYVREGAKPTGSTFDGRSWNTGNGELVNLNNTAGKTYYIMLYAYEAFEGVSINVAAP